MFTYLSYRDPNLLKTVDNYDGERAHMCQLAGSATPFVLPATCDVGLLINSSVQRLTCGL